MSKNRIIALGAASAAAIVIAVFARGYLQPSPPPPPQKIVQQEEKVDVLVAARDIRPGEKLAAAKLQWRPWPKSMLINGMITRDEQPDAMQKLKDKRARNPLVAGEPLLRDKISDLKDGGVLAALLPKGMRAIAVNVTLETGAGGFIMPGDRVDVLLTRRVGGGTITSTVLENVRVLAINQQYVADKSDQPAVTELKTATLEVTPKQAEVLAKVQGMGDLSLALRSLAEEDNLPDAKPRLSPKFARSRGGDMREYRFGFGKLTPALN